MDSVSYSLLNETKTDLIKFRSPWKQLPCKPDIKPNNCKFKFHTHTKCIGIFIGKVISWNKQIDFLHSKLRRANGIYYSIFYSHLLQG